MLFLPQSDWSTLQDKFSPLNPLQLQRVLTRYDCAGASSPSTWFPETQLNADECRLMENFDDHPRLLLPEEGVHLDLSHASSDVSLNNARSRLQLQFARAGSRGLLKHYRLSLSLPFLDFFRQLAAHCRGVPCRHQCNSETSSHQLKLLSTLRPALASSRPTLAPSARERVARVASSHS